MKIENFGAPQSVGIFFNTHPSTEPPPFFAGIFFNTRVCIGHIGRISLMGDRPLPPSAPSPNLGEGY